VRVVQSGQGADEVFGGYDWYPPLLDSRDPLADYARVFFDQDHAGHRRAVAAPYVDIDHSRDFVARHFAASGAEAPVDKALRLDTTVMLVDDPVKRVDNMTMAWGLEARTYRSWITSWSSSPAGCPARHKVAGGGKHILKQVARRFVPAAVIDRPEGLFSGAGAQIPARPVSRFRRGRAGGARGARARRVSPRLRRRAARDPEAHITPLRGSRCGSSRFRRLDAGSRGLMIGMTAFDSVPTRSRGPSDNRHRFERQRSATHRGFGERRPAPQGHERLKPATPCSTAAGGG
jgi:asparagine synthase (glutamine-hydrolysing)